MKIIVSNTIQIQDYTKEILDFVKRKLTYKNTEYERKKRLGYYAYGTPKEIKLYDIYNNSLFVPYGFFNKLYEKHPISSDYIDCTTVKNVDIESNIQLRDYQQPVLNIVKEQCNGLLLAGCGLGKTSMGLGVIGYLKQKSIWLTHNSDLLNQAKERAEQTLNCKTSTITDGSCDISGDIVFCTIQTVIKYIENGTLKQDEFGLLIADEVHRVSANPSSFQMFRQCVEWFNARYRIGMTATKSRADGLENALNDIFGEDIYHIDKVKNNYVGYYLDKELIRFPITDFQVPAYIKVIETNYNIIDKDIFKSNGGTIEFASLISDLAMNEERNKQLIDTLKTINGSTIILSDRVEQLKYLCSKVENGVQIDGKTPKKVRKQVLEDVRNGKYKYLFASYNLCREGLDCPILANIVLATPVKNFATVVQSIGRVQRIYPGKKIAYVYDFVDDVGMLHNFYAKRRSTYRKNDWKIDNKYLGGS